MPILTKHGCNSGGCHGKASGRNGFKLSLFGFEPGPDYQSLVQQARRLADRTAFFLDGQCVEIDDTAALFSGQVQDSRTTDYIEGRFG